ncbi:MAG: AAA family ATPase [Desulfobacterales bacterium]|nr:AAA family ATPase [Desulfobacterales bacterium]
MEISKRIVAIVGPKGGVGKTTISANLAIALSNLGKEVIAVDLDLGASNLHTIFGLKQPKFRLDDFILNKVKSLSDIVCETHLKNLGIICGGDIPGIANLDYNKKLKLIRNLSDLKGDFILLDLGAGASNNVVDFLIIAKEGLLITTPEIPSLLNVYSFIKTMIFRRLNLQFKKNNAIIELLEQAKDFNANPHLKTMEGFLTYAKKIDVEASKSIEKILDNFKSIIIVNRVKSEQDANSGKVIQNLMSQYLNIKTSTIRTIREDNNVQIAIAKMKPVILHAPESLFAKDMSIIARKLL